MKEFNIKLDQIKTKTMTVHYANCPNCGEVLEDLDYSLSEGSVIKCSGCGCEILIGNLCKESW